MNLYISNCSKLEKLDCSYSKLNSLDLNSSKLKRIDCSKSKLTSLDLSNCSKSVEVIKDSNLDIRKKEQIRNLLIVGRTGGGKSTLSNVLTGTEEFKESSHSVSITKSFQKKTFDYKNEETETETKYCVIDTIGVVDTVLSDEKVIYKIIDGIYSVPEGISQVLFVING